MQTTQARKKTAEEEKQAALDKRVEFANSKVKLDSKLEHKRKLRESAEAKKKAADQKSLITSQKSEKRYEYKDWQKEMGNDLVTCVFNGKAADCARWVRDPRSNLLRLFSPKVGTLTASAHPTGVFRSTVPCWY
jgi:hypothetical protein